MKLSYLAPATKQKLKICVISTTVLHCPPKGYSGLEMIAWQVAEGLRSKGHDVMLVAPRGSQTSCELHETTLGESERIAFSCGYAAKLHKFDVIIDHSWEKWSYILKLHNKLPVPILGVLHAPVETMYMTPPPIPTPCLVCISKDQSINAKEHLKCDNRVAYNGVDIDSYKNSNKQRNNRYLFLARISTIKGPHIAVDVANNCQVGLDLVGDDRITGEPDLLNYIKQKCVMSPYLRYVGHQDRDECVNWFNSNKAMLHPNKLFREPFGLAPVEAQLCGMPVIAWKNGALQETVKDKESGFLVESQEEMQELIKSDAVSSIKADNCIEWASQFSHINMINRYEELCFESLESGGW
jgi:glycosyltransferase involved in cell wall biosynthesis